MWGAVTGVAASAVPGIWTVADATGAGGDSFDPYTLIVSGLTPALVVILLLTRKLITPGELDAVRTDRDAWKARAEKAEADRAEMQDRVAERYIPGANKMTAVMEAVLPVLERVTPGMLALRNAREGGDSE